MPDQSETTDAEARVMSLRAGLVSEIDRREREVAALKSKLAGVDMVIAALRENGQDG